MKAALISGLALVLSSLACAAGAAELELEVRGIAKPEGEVMVAVFTEAEGWLRKPATVAKQPAAGQQGGSVRLVLKDLPEGAVALSVFQDLNGNGRLDVNAMGVPKEPFGFSNNAAGSFGPPRFEQARIALKGTVQAIVTLN